MTKLLQNAFTAATKLSDERQDEIGEIVLAAIDQERSSLRLSRQQVAEIERRRGGPDDFATDAEVEAFFRRLAG
jgi:CRISPR/Cas system-associated protein Csm6